MASYVPHEREPYKKKVLLSKAERALVAAVESDAPEARLNQAAERVRAAMLGVIKGERHCLQIYRDDDDSDKRQQRLLNLDEQRDHWQALSVEEIIQMYTGLQS